MHGKDTNIRENERPFTRNINRKHLNKRTEGSNIRENERPFTHNINRKHTNKRTKGSFGRHGKEDVYQ